MSSARLKEIYDEIANLAQQDEDREEWIGFLHPDTFAEFRHPSNSAQMVDTTLYVSGLEVRENELVQRGTIVLIPKEDVLDEPPPPATT